MEDSPQRFQTVWRHLGQRSFFKLICGGSFSEPERLQQLIRVYAQAGVSAIDVSAALHVVQAAVSVLDSLENPPVLMASFPLDEDPHFRKIELVEPDCIRCGACLPVCPTQVFELPTDSALQVETPLCYGCGRCVPVCPTDALRLDPFKVYPDLTTVLSMPQVSAVEIHTTHADPVMLEALYREMGELLQGKLISLCFRPQNLPLSQSLDFIRLLKSKTPYPLIVQVDGIPMSGSDDPKASLPALRAAVSLAPSLPRDCFLTVSGGINHMTAQYLQEPQLEAIQGVGMGTYARQVVWNDLPNQALSQQQAQTLVKLFQSQKKSAIIPT